MREIADLGTKMMSSNLDTRDRKRRMSNIRRDALVRHVDGGQGTTCASRADGTEILVEWDDLSRTWESADDLRVLQ